MTTPPPAAKSAAAGAGRGGEGDVAGGFDEESLDVVGELADIVLLGVPGAHEAASALADEGVELPAELAEGMDDVGREIGEDGIGLGGEENPDFGKGGESVVEQAGHGVGMGGVPEPGAVAEVYFHVRLL